MKIGDYIEVLDDTIRGHIVRFTPQEVTVLTTEGFELTFRRDEVIVIEEEGTLQGAFVNMDEESLRKDVVSKRKNKSPADGSGFAHRAVGRFDKAYDEPRYAYVAARDSPPAAGVCHSAADTASGVYSRSRGGGIAHRIGISFGALLQCYFLRCRIRQIRRRSDGSIYLSKCKIR